MFGPMTDAIHTAVISFAEMVALLGRHAGQEVRAAGLIGALMPMAAGNPWFDGVVVPPGAVPPADSSDLPTGVWTIADTVPGRVAGPSMPCMIRRLTDLPAPADVEVAEPDATTLGALNDRAYDSPPLFTGIAPRLADPRLRRHGLWRDGAFRCVAMTLAMGDDLAIHYVATDPAWQRRGLAAALLTAILHDAVASGFQTASLQSSPDGFPIYQRLGFETVTTLNGFLRP